jgi:hypothetical protein
MAGSHEPLDRFLRARPDPVQQTATVGIEISQTIGLQPIGQNTKQQMAGNVRRRWPPEGHMPSGSEVADIEIAQTRDLVLKPLSIRHRRADHHARHGVYAARRERREAERALPLWTTR